MNEQQESSSMGKSAWQSQVLDAPPISLAFVHHQVGRLNADIRRQTQLMYVAIGICVIVPLVTLLSTDSSVSSSMVYVTRIGMVLALLGAMYVALQVRRRGSRLVARPDESVLQSLEAYRAELQRRRDYYLDSWRWSLWPMLPALLVLLLGGALYDSRPHVASHYALMGLFVVAFTLLGIWEHRRKGRTFQQELDALGTLQRPAG